MSSIASNIIDKFGGVRPLARDLGLSPSVVQGWKDRGVIPAKRQQDLFNLAKRKRVDLRADDFFEAA